MKNKQKKSSSKSQEDRAREKRYGGGDDRGRSGRKGATGSSKVSHHNYPPQFEPLSTDEIKVLRTRVKSIPNESLEAMRRVLDVRDGRGQQRVQKRTIESRHIVRKHMHDLSNIQGGEQDAVVKLFRRFLGRDQNMEGLIERLRSACGHIDRVVKRRKRSVPSKSRDKAPIVVPTAGMSMKDLASELGIKLSEVIKRLRRENVVVTRQSHLGPEDIETALLAFDRVPAESAEGDQTVIVSGMNNDDNGTFVDRQPVIAVMGHVDHGKTTLLDTIRSTGSPTDEAGGITQSVTAFQTRFGDMQSTFIDTPGHAAFMSMRESGASVTDVLLLVVAAQDGVKDQTVETLRMAREMDLPVVLALNKVDLLAEHERPTLRAKVDEGLLAHGFASEELGGDVQVVEVSAKTGEGLDDLCESLGLQIEVLELRTDDNAPGEATVIESSIKPGLGATTNAIVRWGTLRVGEYVVSGSEYARVRHLRVHGESGYDDVDEVKAGQPVEILGFSNTLISGSQLLTAKDEDHAELVCEARVSRTMMEEAQVQERKRMEEEARRREELRAEAEKNRREYEKMDWFARQAYDAAKKRETNANIADADRSNEEKAQANILLKADSEGSLNSIVESMRTFPQEKVELNVVHSQVGAVSKSDVFKAQSFDASIFAFNVKANKSTKKAAEKSDVVLHNYDVIYSLLDGVKEHMASSLDPIVVENQIGYANVLQVFPIGNGKVHAAGCRVEDGTIRRGSTIRVVRNGEEVARKTNAVSMKHFSDDVSEAKQGTEFAIVLDKNISYEIGDRIESIEIIEAPQEL